MSVSWHVSFFWVERKRGILLKTQIGLSKKVDWKAVLEGRGQLGPVLAFRPGSAY